MLDNSWTTFVDLPFNPPICYEAIPCGYYPSVLILHGFEINKAFQGLYLCSVPSFWFHHCHLRHTQTTWNWYFRTVYSFWIIASLGFYFRVFADADAYKRYGVEYGCGLLNIIIKSYTMLTKNKGINVTYIKVEWCPQLLEGEDPGPTQPPDHVDLFLTMTDDDELTDWW